MRKNVIKLTCLASAALLAQGVTAPIMADTVAGLNAETGVTSQHSNGTRNARTPLRFATSTSAAALSSSSSSSSSSSAVDWSSKDPYAVMGTLPLAQPNDVWQATGPNNATEIVYSYNPGYATPAGNDDGMGDSVVDGEPDATVNYQRIPAWDATSQDGFNGQNVNEIAAVLYAGYPNCLGNTQNIYSAPISNSQVNQWYQAYLQKTGKNSAEYSLDQYEYDMTQYAIWGVEGNVAGGSNAGTAQSQYKNDPLSLALYNYGVQHPLNAQQVAQNGVQLLNSNGQPIGAKQVYTIDRSTGRSKDFQVVNGDMTVPTSNDYYVADANGNKVSVLVPGVKYHLVLAVNGSDPTTISMLCNYVQTESVDFYHSDVPAATSLSGQPNTAKLPWANMIGMGVTTGKVTLNFAVVSSSSSSSSAVSSSSSSSSSSVSSSSSSSASSSSSSASSSLSSSSSSAVDSSSSSSSSKSSSSSSSKSSSSTKTAAKTSSSSKATNAKSSSSSKVADDKTSSSSQASNQSSSSVTVDPNASSSSSAVQPATNTSVASSSQKPATADNKVPAASAGAPTTAKHAATSAQRTNTNRHVAPAANKAVLAHGATDKQAADAQSVATQRHDKRALPDTGDAVAAGLTLTGMAALLGGAALVLKKRKD
ncbi:LPXTG cell wall anchor domain-containing protein [Ligilactobacillus hohenheimensis]|uniref:LPXTG cell wall anchor domain-containing protein n=1 Tax=Ligilactobacillus hohenheimensis TaxID=2991832 RepID=UPI0024BB02DF|nr:LPXTG cell wall anchor domain-containing protein [Ligilactobacillus hohenheimensis]